MRAERRQSGFTLIEVVVAIAVVALGMMAVFRVVHDTVNNSIYLRDRTMATWIADNRLVEMRLAAELPSVDETSGEVEYANQRWQWDATVSQTPVDDLRRIDIRVRREGDSEDSALAEVSGFVGAVAMTTAPSAALWNGIPGGTDNDQEGDNGNRNDGRQQPAVRPPPAPVAPGSEDE